MAVYDKNFTPVADLNRKREAEAQLKARLAPGDPGDEIKNAGLAFMKNGRDTPASLARKHTALVNFRERDSERLAGVKQQLYKEEADRRNTALGIAGDMGRQQLIGKQNLGLARFNAKNNRSLQELMGEQQLGLARLKTGASGARAGADKGALTAKDKFDIRKGLNAEFYGDNPAGEALRKKYGENGFGLFATQMEQRYQPQQAGTAQLPQPVDQSYGTISRGGQVIAGSTGGLPTDPEAFATQLKQGLQPVVQQQILQPTGRVQATLPKEMGLPKPTDTAFRRPPSLEEFERMQQEEREQEVTEAFRRPPTLAEFKRKQSPQKRLRPYTRRAPALPNQELLRSQRLWGAGGESY